ncbi:MAG: hypothetical protein LUQ69_06665 [Methanoregulaceae archaeon]|nr:hypothetical protein [Methanoregulaceae archaeon]
MYAAGTIGMLAVAFREALAGMTRRPVLWIPGIFLGLFAFSDLMIEYYWGGFLAGRLWIVGLIIFPLFIAGMLNAIRKEDSGSGSFFREGAKRYFRVLLPTLIILFAALMTVGLVVVSLSLIGISPGSGLLVLPIFGVIVPFIFFTLFYDSIAVFEDTRAFESIRRSIELVLTYPSAVIGFCIVSLLVIAGVSGILLIIWTGALYTKLEPVASWNTTQIQEITAESMVTLLGPGGIWITAAIVACGIILLTTFFYTFKGCMYRQIVNGTPPMPSMGGEFDEKGRWYKY